MAGRREGPAETAVGPLFARMAGEFRKLTLHAEGDGIGGAVFPGTEEGPVFLAFAYPAAPREKEGAPERGPGGRYCLTAEAAADLRYGDAVLRLSDGMIFRVTGEVRHSPASLGLIAADAEPLTGGDRPFPETADEAEEADA